MRSNKLVTYAAIVMTVGAMTADSEDSPSLKKERYQTELDRIVRERARDDLFPLPSYSFAALQAAVEGYSGDCQLQLIYEPKRKIPRQVTIKFVCHGKDALAIDGHPDSTFVSVENVLYFAHTPLSPQGSGCIVAAYDLTTAKKIWETELNALGGNPPQTVQNKVRMGLVGLDQEGRLVRKLDEVVWIRGQESRAGYIEFLDRKTGFILAQKVLQKRGEPVNRNDSK